MTKSQKVSTASPEYRQFIKQLKDRVFSARLSAARAVNSSLIRLYWDIGHGIVEKQQALGWGESVVEMVSADLKQAFPQMSGFSPRNVWAMRRLYATYTAPDFLAQAVRESDHVKGGQILQQAVAEFGGDKKRRQAVVKLTESKVRAITGSFSTRSPTPRLSCITFAPPPASAGRGMSCSTRSRPARMNGR